MAKVEIILCDRCSDEIPLTVSNSHAAHRLVRYNSDYHGTRVDLCARCWDQFENWLSSNNPPGFVKRLRPCPHNVPCADPNGCSGYELVPE